MAGTIGKLASSGAMSKMMDQQKGKRANPMHAATASKYGTAKDLSNSQSLQGLLSMADIQPQQQQQQRALSQVDVDEYIRSLLGG